MKINSEFYVGELRALILCIDGTLVDGIKRMKQLKRIAEVCAFLMPWAKEAIWRKTAEEVQTISMGFNLLIEMREKILDSEGCDEDMQPATLRQMLNVK